MDKGGCVGLSDPDPCQRRQHCDGRWVRGQCGGGYGPWLLWCAGGQLHQRAGGLGQRHDPGRVQCRPGQWGFCGHQQHVVGGQCDPRWQGLRQHERRQPRCAVVRECIGQQFAHHQRHWGRHRVHLDQRRCQLRCFYLWRGGRSHGHGQCGHQRHGRWLPARCEQPRSIHSGDPDRCQHPFGVGFGARDRDARHVRLVRGQCGCLCSFVAVRCLCQCSVGRQHTNRGADLAL